MRFFACVVGAKSASWRSGVCDAIRPHHNLPILQNSPILQIHLYFQLPLMGGRIALKGRANCPQRKGELPSKEGRIAHNGWANCNSPLHVRYPNVGKYTYKSCKYTKKKTSWAWYEGVCVCRRGELQFAHVAIHPYCKIHPRCKIRPHFKFTHMEGRITIRPYTCVFWMLANIHVIKYKYTCKYLNTCKLMIERIYIPT